MCRAVTINCGKGYEHGCFATRNNLVCFGQALFFQFHIRGKGLHMVQDQEQGSASVEEQTGKPVRNPYILNFCRILVEKKEESHEPEALERFVQRARNSAEPNLQGPAESEHIVGREIDVNIPTAVCGTGLGVLTEKRKQAILRQDEFFLV
jgi:hypothetical protein